MPRNGAAAREMVRNGAILQEVGCAREQVRVVAQERTMAALAVEQLDTPVPTTSSYN